MTSFAYLSSPHRYTSKRLVLVSCFLFNALLLNPSYVNSFTTSIITQREKNNNHIHGNNPVGGTQNNNAAYSSLFSSSESQETNEDALGLTDELRKLTNAFAMIGDDKMRYKQLLYMAQNGIKVMPEIHKTEENKVPGCLSTVHVRATATYEDGNSVPMVNFEGDSDGLITKGLVALLVRGLSGNTADDIQKVDPTFIEEAQITQSLTPGRNNGFLNMLTKMKQQSLDVSSPTATETFESGSSTENEDENVAADDDDDENDSSTSSLYDTIVTTLQVLKPTILELKQDGTSNNFDLLAVADIFDGLSIDQRQQIASTVLADAMSEIESMNIELLSQDEYDNRK